MKIEQIKITDIRPYDRNPRKNDRAVDTVAKSIEQFGFQQPIVVDKNHIIVVGHTRYRAAKKLKMKTVPVVIAAELDEDQVQSYRIMDNRSNENAEWDDSLLLEELLTIEKTQGSIESTGFTQDQLDELLGKTQQEQHTAYTKKIDTPVYTPKGHKPEIKDLYDESTARRLSTAIIAADIPEPVKEFLLAAALRHTVFNYHNIAEYYCHADPITQQLMEQSALVIIDFNQAIEQGYVTLNEELKDVYLRSYTETQDD